MSSILERVRQIASKASSKRMAAIQARSAVAQDLNIIGDDADDFVDLLAQDFGDGVFEWPWERFLCFNEAVALQAPLRALWRMLRLPWINTAFASAPALERLEVAHIVAVIEKREWFDP